ncbi:MAG: hypothetical protein V4534_07610 [Myxococcota bacterium]
MKSKFIFSMLICLGALADGPDPKSCEEVAQIMSPLQKPPVTVSTKDGECCVSMAGLPDNCMPLETMVNQMRTEQRLTQEQEEQRAACYDELVESGRDMTGVLPLPGPGCQFTVIGKNFQEL